jgi:AcrR family transcriptional regulator
MAKRGAAKSRGGRPTKSAAVQRDLRLIDTATRLFLERGFDATSIDAVAEAARVSKPTVYSQYGDKRGLFAAVLRREIARWLAPLAAAAETQVSSSSGASVEQRLVDVGRQMLALSCSVDAAALGRMLTAQATNFPELAKLAEEEGWLKAVATTARFFDRLVAEGSLQIEDTTIAAEVFLNIAVGRLHRLSSYGTPIDMRVAEKRMRMSIRLFLTGVLPPNQARSAPKGAARRPPSR